jgi:uncharacterized protein (TIGR03435 family)
MKNERSVCKLGFTSELLLNTAGFAIFIVLTLLASALGSLNAQSAAQTPSANPPPAQATAAPPDRQTAASGKLEFEVASVRPKDPDSDNTLNGTMDQVPPRSDLFSASNYLWHYIVFAYHLSHSDRQTQSLLNSIVAAKLNSVKWDVEARTDGIPTQEQLREMVRSLLEDRFKLRVHYETRQGPIYALVVGAPGKFGPQMHVHSGTTPCIKVASEAAQAPTAEKSTLYCGEVRFWWDQNSVINVTMAKAPMGELVDTLDHLGSWGGGLFAIPIVDQTGLKGEYDLQLQFALSPRFDHPDEKVPGPGGPTFTEALKKQLGFRLVKTSGPVQFLVIDHIERPTEN